MKLRREMAQGFFPPIPSLGNLGAGRLVVVGFVNISYLAILSALYQGLPSPTGLLVYVLLSVLTTAIVFADSLFHPFVLLFATKTLFILDFLGKDLRGVTLRWAEVGLPGSNYFRGLGLLLILVWVVFFFVGYKGSGWCPILGNTLSGLTPGRTFRRPWATSILFLALALVALFIARDLAGGSFLAMLRRMDDRAEIYAGWQFLRPLVRFSAIAAILVGWQGYNKFSYGILSLGIIGTGLFGGRGAAIFGVALPYLIGHHFLIRPIRRRTIFFGGVAAAIAALAWGQYRDFNTLRLRALTVKGFIFSLADNTGGADNLPSLLWGIKDGTMNVVWGKHLLNGPIGLIPRKIWPGKPLITGGAIVGRALMGSDSFAIPVGPWGWVYLNLWWPGVILGGLLTGYLTGQFYSWVKADLAAPRSDGVLSVLGYSFLGATMLNIVIPQAQVQLALFSLLLLILILSDRTVDLILRFARASPQG